MPLTPGELTKIGKAVSDLLARPGNSELSAEELGREVAEAIISEYEEAQAKSYNLVVLGHFRIESDKSYVAAVGPLSTRATQRARGVGERFAWDYKTRTGTGQYTLVPLVRDPAQAWDEARAGEVREVIDLAHREGDGPPYYNMGRPYERVPACICGVKAEREQLFACPRHPEGRSDGSNA